MTTSPNQHLRDALSVLDWRRRTAATYLEVRRLAATDPAGAHATWVNRRDEMFADHPATPLTPADRTQFTGLPVAPYDPAYRFEVTVEPAGEPATFEATTGTDGVVGFTRIGRVQLGGLGRLDVWLLRSYGGGLFVPVKDALAGAVGGTYGGGRYVLDTIKGADLGSSSRAGTPVLVVDLNFAYNPSCAYDAAWACPLAPAGNVLAAPVPVGERIARPAAGSVPGSDAGPDAADSPA